MRTVERHSADTTARTKRSLVALLRFKKSSLPDDSEMTLRIRSGKSTQASM